jgi:hypothetical protein
MSVTFISSSLSLWAISNHRTYLSFLLLSFVSWIRHLSSTEFFLLLLSCLQRYVNKKKTDNSVCINEKKTRRRIFRPIRIPEEHILTLSFFLSLSPLSSLFVAYIKWAVYINEILISLHFLFLVKQLLNCILAGRWISHRCLLMPDLYSSSSYQ